MIDTQGIPEILKSATVQRSRQEDALRLYRPMEGPQLDFHRSRASEIVNQGGNQSGKSTCTAMEVASAATGIPIIGPDGKPLPHKYPTDRPLLIWIIGYNVDHIGSTMHRLLFRAGAFRIIRDQETGLFRAWRPWEADDAARETETRPAPPLIPPRFIDPDSWSWHNKSARIFNSVRLKSRWKEFDDGTEIHAHASTGHVSQGDPVDLIWIDEDIFNAHYYQEWQARLSIKRGRLLWSAWPHTENDALMRVSDRAKEQVGRKNPDVQVFMHDSTRNRYFPPDEMRKRLEGYTDEEIRSRIRGEFVTDTILVYPEFNRHLHGVPRDDSPESIDRIIAEKGGVPAEWTNYLAIDPGHTRTAVLFAAVAPPEFDNVIVIWDELYLARHSAEQTAVECAGRMHGRFFEAFIMDARAGRQTAMGFGRRVVDAYREAFANHQLKSERTGSNFYPGSDNIPARIQRVHEHLTPDLGGRVKIRFLLERTSSTQREFNLYRKRIVMDDKKDRPVDRDDHLMNAMEYLIAYNPTYVVPAARRAFEDSPTMRFKAMVDKIFGSERRGTEYVNLGPPERPLPRSA